MLAKGNKLNRRPPATVEMCIIFIYSNGNPLPGGYKLIVASNRDEFYARPALPAAAWEEDSTVFGGEFIKVHL